MLWSISFLLLSVSLVRIQGAANISVGSVILVALMAFAVTDIIEGGNINPTGSAILIQLKNLLL